MTELGQELLEALKEARNVLDSGPLRDRLSGVIERVEGGDAPRVGDMVFVRDEPSSPWSVDAYQLVEVLNKYEKYRYVVRMFKTGYLTAWGEAKKQ